jgi:hypothetical protein
MNTAPSTKEADLDDLLYPLKVANPYLTEATKRLLLRVTILLRGEFFIKRLSYTSSSTYQLHIEAFLELTDKAKTNRNKAL